MTTTSENITNWRSLADIDYFTQYIKSYLAFNAWMRTRYVGLSKDRKIIDAVKEENNEFRRKIINLLTNDDAEGEDFRSHVSSLHYNLERFEVKNNSLKISFYSVFIEENSETEKSSKRNRLDYKVKLLSSGKVQASILDSQGNQKYLFENNKYDLTALLSDGGYQKLTQNQQTEIRALFFECNPRKSESVISNNATGLKLGQFYFIDDNVRIAKAIIEVLYSLRNTLFHGEVLPDKERNKVYEQAYHILKMLIQIL